VLLQQTYIWFKHWNQKTRVISLTRDIVYSSFEEIEEKGFAVALARAKAHCGI
jgi:hypothetical protein